jgi:hypothetical protein
MSPASASMRSDQSWKPVAASTRRAVMRMRLPACWTLPSSTEATPRLLPTSRTSRRCALNWEVEVREAARSPGSSPRALVSSSVMPSLK